MLWAQFITHTGSCGDPSPSHALLSSLVLLYWIKTPNSHLLSYLRQMQILLDLNTDGFHIWFLITRKFFFSAS